MLSKDDFEIEFGANNVCVVILSSALEPYFGKYYKYDFPKWCAENGLRCFYRLDVCKYIVFPKEGYSEL